MVVGVIGYRYNIIKDTLCIILEFKMVICYIFVDLRMVRVTLRVSN